MCVYGAKRDAFFFGNPHNIFFAVFALRSLVWSPSNIILHLSSAVCLRAFSSISANVTHSIRSTLSLSLFLCLCVCRICISNRSINVLQCVPCIKCSLCFVVVVLFFFSFVSNALLLCVSRHSPPHMIRSRDDASTAEGFNTDTQPRRAELPFDKKKPKRT